MKVTWISEQEIEEIGHAFGYYDYGDETGLVSVYGSQEDAKTYICGYVKTQFRCGTLYTTGRKHEGFISYRIYTFRKGENRHRFIDYIPLFKGVFDSMKISEIVNFFRLYYGGGEPLQSRYMKQKKPHISVGMVVVREKYQHMGYMRKVMELAFEEGRKRNLPVILDTDAKSKRDLYEHLGMRTVQERKLANGSVLYDMLWEPEKQGE